MAAINAARRQVTRAVQVGNLKKVKKLDAEHSLSQDPSWCDNIIGQALRWDRQAIVRFFIEESAKIINDKQRTSILNKVVAKGCQYSSLVNFLLTKGISVNSRDQKGDAPLHCVNTVGIANLLLSQDSSLDVNATNSNGLTPLHMAARRGNLHLVQWLLDHGAQINCTQSGWVASYTPLHLATKYNKTKVVELLLKKGASVNVRSVEGAPLHIACRGKSVDLVKLLVDYGADMEATDMERKTPIFCAIAKDNADIAKALINKGAVLKFSPIQLFNVLIHKSPELVEVLLKHGCDVSKKIKDIGALCFVASSSTFRCRNRDSEIVRLLLDNGADVNAKRNRTGQTALMLALRNKYFRILPTLLEYGADFETRPNGDTLLHLCARAGCKLDLVYHAILKRGADANALNDAGQTPLHIACSSPGSSAFAPEGLLQWPDVDVDARDKEGRTALYLAASKRNLDVLTSLLESGADVNISDNTGSTPIHIVEATRRLSAEYSSPHMIRKYRKVLNISIALRSHVAKLKAAHLYVSEDNMNACKQSMYMYERQFPENLQLPIRRYTANTAYDPEFVKRCEDEVSKMKNEMFGNSRVSYYDVLSNSYNQVAIYTKNPAVSAVMNSEDCFKKFPVYGMWIKCRLRRAERRMPVLENAAASLESIFDFLPHICIDIIVDFLSYDDLKKCGECA